MIRYKDAEIAAIHALVDAISASWRDAADARTRTLKQEKKFIEGVPSSDIKAAYMRLHTTVSCSARSPARSPADRADVEHFRPKNAEKWPSAHARMISTAC